MKFQKLNRLPHVFSSTLNEKKKTLEITLPKLATLSRSNTPYRRKKVLLNLVVQKKKFLAKQQHFNNTASLAPTESCVASELVSQVETFSRVSKSSSTERTVEHLVLVG